MEKYKQANRREHMGEKLGRRQTRKVSRERAGLWQVGRIFHIEETGSVKTQKTEGCGMLKQRR